MLRLYILNSIINIQYIFNMSQRFNININTTLYWCWILIKTLILADLTGAHIIFWEHRYPHSFRSILWHIVQPNGASVGACSVTWPFRVVCIAKTALNSGNGSGDNSKTDFDSWLDCDLCDAVYIVPLATSHKQQQRKFYIDSRISVGRDGFKADQSRCARTLREVSVNVSVSTRRPEGRLTERPCSR